MGTLIHVGTCCYRVVWAKDRRMVKLCERMLSGLPVNHRTGRYRYALFCHGRGFILKRKCVYVVEREADWSDVCEVEPVS